MQLSVVILNYKVPFYLLNCLASVHRAIEGLEAEVIVVDNFSQDESLDLVKQYFPGVKVLALKENFGFSKGNNKGVRAACGKYICLLNPDTVVAEDTFQNFLNFAEKQQKFGALGPKLIDGSGKFLPESKRNIPSPAVAFQKLMGFPKNYYASNDKNNNSPVPILVGAFMWMQKSYYEKVGGLDEDYFMYGEDIDLSFSLLKNGWQNYYLGENPVLHYKGESTVKDKNYRLRFYGAMQVFYQKHFQSNFLSKFLVKTALNIAKKRNGSKVGVLNSGPNGNSIFYFGKDKGFLDKLKKKYPGIQPKTIREIGRLPSKSLLIFDATEYTYSEILYAMESNCDRGHCFRMRPEEFNFIIGSDHNAHRGQVLHL